MKVPNAMMKFQHTAARRRLVAIDIYAFFATCCFNTQPPEGGWLNPNRKQVVDTVSTHSRPKAAGSDLRPRDEAMARFNTQPPEGGWIR